MRTMLVIAALMAVSSSAARMRPMISQVITTEDSTGSKPGKESKADYGLQDRTMHIIFTDVRV